MRIVSLVVKCVPEMRKVVLVGALQARQSKRPDCQSHLRWTFPDIADMLMVRRDQFLADETSESRLQRSNRAEGKEDLYDGCSAAPPKGFMYTRSDRALAARCF